MKGGFLSWHSVFLLELISSLEVGVNKVGALSVFLVVLMGWGMLEEEHLSLQKEQRKILQRRWNLS